MTLEKLLVFVEGKESGQASQGMMTGGTATGNAADQVKKCGYCGEDHKKGIKFCKAAKVKCDCGKIGHFTKMCRNQGKPRMGPSQEKKPGDGKWVGHGTDKKEEGQPRDDGWTK